MQSSQWLHYLTFVVLFVVAGCGPRSSNNGTQSSQSQTVDAVHQAALELTMKGKIDEALRLLDGAVGQSPRRSELYLTRGIVLRKRGDYSKAIADFTTALEIDPTLADAYCQRGFAYQQSQDDNWHEKAFADCNRAIELGHNSALSLLVRGNAYIARNEFERAIADFTNALELNPRSYSAYGNRARAYSRIGKFPEAREDLARAMALNPSPEDLPGLQAIKELLEAQPNAP